MKEILKNLVGKPYKHNASGPHFYDCWGLCLEVARRLDRQLPEYDTPETTGERNALIVTEKDSRFERLDKPEPWCLVIFRIFEDNGDERWHVGTVLGGCRRFIHVGGRLRVCITSISHPFWDLFLEGFYRYAG